MSSSCFGDSFFLSVNTGDTCYTSKHLKSAVNSSSVEVQDVIFFTIWGSKTSLQTIITLKQFLSHHSLKRTGGRFYLVCTGPPSVRDSIPGKNRRLFVLPSNQTESGSSPASCSIETGVFSLPRCSGRPQSPATPKSRLRPCKSLQLLRVRSANFSKPCKVLE
jgi:hypothetical protein